MGWEKYFSQFSAVLVALSLDELTVDGQIAFDSRMTAA
jgi:hypothetical protein